MCSFRGSFANRGNGTEQSSSDVVREAGLEPARPEWTLEPEFEKIRSSAYRAVSPRTAKSLDFSGFFGSHACKFSNRARCKKTVVC